MTGLLDKPQSIFNFEATIPPCNRSRAMKHWCCGAAGKASKWISFSIQFIAAIILAREIFGSSKAVAQDTGGAVISRYGYSLVFGEIKGSNNRGLIPTNQLKLCDKSTGYRWGYIIIPPNNSNAYHEFMVVFAPPVKSDGEVGPQAKPQVLDVGTHTGTSVNEIWFDKEDRLGTWQIRLHVGTQEVGRVTFDVLPAQSCP